MIKGPPLTSVTKQLFSEQSHAKLSRNQTPPERCWGCYCIRTLHLHCLAGSVTSWRDSGGITRERCYSTMPASVQVLLQHLEDFTSLLCKFPLRKVFTLNLLKKKLHLQPLFLLSLAIPSHFSLLFFLLLPCHLRVIKTG